MIGQSKVCYRNAYLKAETTNLKFSLEEAEHTQSSSESISEDQIPKKVNLLNILKDRKFISSAHAICIEEMDNTDLQLEAVLQVLKQGSVSSFKVAVEFFQQTNQTEVVDVLLANYRDEGNIYIGFIHRSTNMLPHLISFHLPSSNSAHLFLWNSLSYSLICPVKVYSHPLSSKQLSCYYW